MILGAVAALGLAAQPTTVVTIDPSHRLIEGLATDGRSIWVSSLIDRQILQCRKRCATIATLPEGLHPFAIAWDSKRKRLWVAADCPPGVPFIKPCERGALIALDKRGKVRTRISPPIGSFHPGDVSAAGDRVFVSDSQSGMIYRLLPSGKALMALVLPGVGKSGQGSVLDAAGKSLIASDYSQGITVIDLDRNEATCTSPGQQAVATRYRWPRALRRHLFRRLQWISSGAPTGLPDRPGRRRLCRPDRGPDAAGSDPGCLRRQARAGRCRQRMGIGWKRPKPHLRRADSCYPAREGLQATVAKPYCDSFSHFHALPDAGRRPKAPPFL